MLVAHLVGGKKGEGRCLTKKNWMVHTPSLCHVHVAKRGGGKEGRGGVGRHLQLAASFLGGGKRGRRRGVQGRTVEDAERRRPVGGGGKEAFLRQEEGKKGSSTGPCPPARRQGKGRMWSDFYLAAVAKKRKKRF